MYPILFKLIHTEIKLNLKAVPMNLCMHIYIWMNIYTHTHRVFEKQVGFAF